MSYRPACFAVALAAVAALPSVGSAEVIYGLTNLQTIVTFDSNTRNVTNTVAAGTFSLAGEFLRSIDTRPANGQVYGLSNQGRLFTIDPTTGTSTLVGGANFASPDNSNLPAVDFNPMVDRLRVVNRVAQNGRINPNDGSLTMADPNLAYAAGDAGAGTTPAGVGVAYTNNRPGATATTLYTLEANRDVLTMQNPANNGTLISVGSLGIDLGATGGFVGFDISSTDGTAFLTAFNFGGAPAPTRNALYTVNLTTGAAALQGNINGVASNDTVISIAVGTIVPEPASLAAVALLGLPLMRRRQK